MRRILIEVVLSPDNVNESGEHTAVDLEIRKAIPIFRSFEIIKKSIDARKKKSVLIRYRCAVALDDGVADRLIAAGAEEYLEPRIPDVPVITRRSRVIVVGMGPAGLFCAHRLTQAGVDVTVIERGKPIGERDNDVAVLRRSGALNPESNVVFGEGGAGTYSDGKLTTRIHKGPVDVVFRTLVEYGAPGNILYDAKPHVGTDILSRVVRAMRSSLIKKGAAIVFNERVTGIVTDGNGAAGVLTSGGKEYLSDMVVLAIGHSARDTYTMLHREGIVLEKKGFAAGFRIEHPARFINRSQYGAFSDCLPAADYRLAYNNPETGRGVYSFCMCPGGEVINSSSEEGMLCVNGMSFSSRNGTFSNAAIVVSLGIEDFPGDVLSGIEFQREIERNAFRCGGGGFTSPIQRAANFIDGRLSSGDVRTSYQPTFASADLSSVFPSFMRKELSNGLRYFDRLIPGFIEHGVCIGVESRTSSPVRITRSETMESISMKNLYPIGEGAGYAGGIVSSAVDGVKCADRIISGLSS